MRILKPLFATAALATAIAAAPGALTGHLAVWQVALATFMPQGIASPVGGILADRYDRRKVFATELMAQAA